MPDMTNPFQIIQRWWQAVQSNVGRLDVDPTEVLDNADSSALPMTLQDRLEQAVEELLPPTIHIEDVVNVVQKAIQRWQDYDVMPNMMVVLADPVQSMDGVITGVLQRLNDEPDFQHIQTYRLDDWLERPADYCSIDNTVRDAIASIFKEIRKSDRPSSDSPTNLGEPKAHPSTPAAEHRSNHPADSAAAENRPEAKVNEEAGEEAGEEIEKPPIHVIVIPALDRYFLRCIDGLEAIETIRQIIVDHPDYFWLVGCNSWAWSYLDKVCYISAYLDSCWRLSTLDALDFKAWLQPLQAVAELPPFENEETRSPSEQPPATPGSTLPAHAARQAPDKKQAKTEPDWVSSDEQKYFSSIEKASNGVAAVAAALWQASLRYELVDPSTDRPAQVDQDDDPLGKVQRGKIKVPDVPSLTVDDRYLLYAVLLHGSLSRQHLALSLAEPQGMVRAQLQSLSRQDLLLRKNRGWVINPAYYPSLSKELKRNNFLVD